MSEEARFTKAELLSATDLTGKRRDILDAALDDDKTYSVAEAKAAIDAFKGGLF
jgi:hypothetical protein